MVPSPKHIYLTSNRTNRRKPRTEVPADAVLGHARRGRGLRLEPAVELVGRGAVHVELRVMRVSVSVRVCARSAGWGRKAVASASISLPCQTRGRWRRRCP